MKKMSQSQPVKNSPGHDMYDMDMRTKQGIAINLLTAIAIIIYWLLALFTGIPVEESVPGYANWFMSVLIATCWIVFCNFLSAWYLYKHYAHGLLFGLLAGSSLIFLGLNASLYGVFSGRIFQLPLDEIVVRLIRVGVVIMAGSLLIITLWNNRNLHQGRPSP